VPTGLRLPGRGSRAGGGVGLRVEAVWYVINVHRRPDELGQVALQFEKIPVEHLDGALERFNPFLSSLARQGRDGTHGARPRCRMGCLP
jgi:hypothetical protein